MAKKLKKSVKKQVKTNKPASAVTTSAEPRTLKKSTYQSFRLQKPIKGDKLPSAPRLFANALTILGKHWKVFLGIVVVYGLLNALLVQGFKISGGLDESKTLLEQAFSGNLSHLRTGFTLFFYLVGSSGNTSNPTAGAYQFMLVIVVSLALIWTLRQVYAGQKVRVRDGFYNGMAPLIKWILVLLVIGLQLIPLTIGIMLYGAVVSNGIAVSALEQVVWALLTFLLTLLSLYMVSSSLFALYIVTLPDMTPLSALRSARQLVAHRRWAVMRKVFFLPIILLVLAGLIVVPFIMYATPIAALVFFALSMLLIPTAHSYIYTLYRSMV